ncbi:helix-turn-helix domain-containing protein, partial [Streptomyces sp. NPDC001920]
MNKDERRDCKGGGSVGTGDFRDPVAALTELRAQLKAGYAKWGGTQTELARRVGLGRTTVNQALSASTKAPSPQTVAALAHVFGLEARPLLDLLALASRSAGRHHGAVGRPITEYDPIDLEVHPAVDVPAADGEQTTHPPRRLRAAALPRYVSRPHDAALSEIVAAAADGHSQMAVLVGSSSTGKTRTCWEAIQPLTSSGWRLWHPVDPTRAEAALASMDRIAPRTVVWLNEAQHYLGAGADVGERIAAALHSLLTESSRGPVLILCTLWSEYVTVYATLPRPGEPDPHSRVRELLDGRLITLPDHFDADAITAAQALAEGGDEQLAYALQHAREGRLAQFLAGAPHLLRRYHTATPAARAVLEAAMDARRLGAGPHLSMTFLSYAAEGYLTDTDFDALNDNWFDQALAELGQPVHGNLAPLHRIRPRRAGRTRDTESHSWAVPTAYQLSDYLEQHGRRARWTLCPPASFWEAAHLRLTNVDGLTELARAASVRHRLYWAYRLWRRAAHAGHSPAFLSLARIREGLGDREAAEKLYAQGAAAGDVEALRNLARMRAEAGDQERAQTLYQRARNAEEAAGVRRISRYEEDLMLLRSSAQAGSLWAQARLAWHRTGDSKTVNALYESAATKGNVEAMVEVARTRKAAGDRETAEAMYQKAAASGDTRALIEGALMRKEAGDHEAAVALLHKAVQEGNRYTKGSALAELARIREEAGDHEGAERLANQALTAGDTKALTELARIREKTGHHGSAERLANQALTAGDTKALTELARIREKTGHHESAERLANQALTAGDTKALTELARIREKTGHHE